MSRRASMLHLQALRLGTVAAPPQGTCCSRAPCRHPRRSSAARQSSAGADRAYCCEAEWQRSGDTGNGGNGEGARVLAVALALTAQRTHAQPSPGAVHATRDWWSWSTTACVSVRLTLSARSAATAVPRAGTRRLRSTRLDTVRDAHPSRVTHLDAPQLARCPSGWNDSFDAALWRASARTARTRRRVPHVLPRRMAMHLGGAYARAA